MGIYRAQRKKAFENSVRTLYISSFSTTSLYILIHSVPSFSYSFQKKHNVFFIRITLFIHSANLYISFPFYAMWNGFSKRCSGFPHFYLKTYKTHQPLSQQAAQPTGKEQVWFPIDQIIVLSWFEYGWKKDFKEYKGTYRFRRGHFISVYRPVFQSYLLQQIRCCRLGVKLSLFYIPVFRAVFFQVQRYFSLFGIPVFRAVQCLYNGEPLNLV